MDKLKLVEAALRELGDASAEQLSAFIQQKHGVRIAPFFIPVFIATIRDKLRLENVRHAARAAIATAA